MDKVLVYPAYFPCALQLAAMAQADSVVFELHDNYQKQTYRNRAYIAHSNGLLVLNAPIIKHKISGYSRSKTKAIPTGVHPPSQQHHFKPTESAYRHSACYDFYLDALMSLLTTPVESLQTHTMKIFNIFCRVLE